MADSRPLCASCNEHHWVTETCITRLVMPKPPLYPAPAVRGVDTKSVIEQAIEALKNANVQPPYTAIVHPSDIAPWHPSEHLLKGDDMNPTRIKDGRIKVSWSQAICADCYDKRYPGRTPVRLVSGHREQCCDCGMPTTDGIYVREDPMTVRFPRVVRDDE